MMLVSDTRDSVVCSLPHSTEAQDLGHRAGQGTCTEDPSLSLPQENYPAQQDVVTHAHNIFALAKMRQEDRLKFEDSLGYLLRPYFNVLASPHETKVHHQQNLPQNHIVSTKRLTCSV